ncbi:MAG: patatin-like phospholipase family protein [Alistipes sp.]|nr:patatin-like phospholipase family protein [Alistipes sp.]
MRTLNATIIIFSLFLLSLLPTVAQAQSVGVVMSGGGAKGLYHIGVLRALEENDIPIDYIAGTSMGSIIGGMYASGYTIEEMEAVALSGDMARWASGGIDPKYTYYHTERDQLSNMITLYFDTDNTRSAEKSAERRLHLPGSVINTAEIDVALNGFFAPASAAAGNDFDRLMIPFRCMATDMVRHTAVELRRGDLARAIRASMALPVAFPPVEIDSVLMCDGGCYDNFPWRTMDEAFHPDIIIGACCVDIEPRVRRNSSVVDQVMSLITMPSDFDLPEGRSVLVQRSVDASTLDFADAERIMALGYNDALAAIPRIRELVSRRQSHDEIMARREAFREKFSNGSVGEINVGGLNDNQTVTVERMLRVGRKRRDAAQPMTLAELNDNYLTMLANTAVSSDFPKVQYNDTTGLYDIHLRLATKPKLDLSFGGNISSTVFNQAYIGVEYGWWGRAVQSFKVDVLLGPVYTMARAGGRTTITRRHPIYFDYSYNFNIMNTLRGNFGNLTPVDNAEQMKAMENFVSLSVGAALTRKSVADFTLNVGRNGYSYEMAGYSKRQYTNFSYLAGGLSLERTSLNKPLFPTSGSRLGASAIYVYGRDERDSREDLIFPEGGDYVDVRRQWWGAKLSWEQYFDVTRNGVFSWGYAVEGVYTNHSTLDSPEATLLSSPQYAPLLHSRMIYMPEFRADRYVGVGVMPTVRLYNNLYARLSAYVMWRDKFNDSILHYMSDLSIIYHTPIGPVSLALTKYGFDSTKNLYLTFNFGYAIFGRKGLFY